MTEGSEHHVGRVDLVRARRYCARIVRDRHLAEDVVQEAFLRVMDRSSTFQDRDHFDRYFFKTMTHLCLNALDRRHRRDESLDHSEVADRQVSHPAAAEAREMDRLIARALDRLLPVQAVAVILREREGLSYREIGHRLETSEANAATLVYRGLKALKIELRGHVEEYRR